CPFGDADNVIGNEARAFGGAVFGILEAALPFEHRPAVEIVAGKFREDGLEVDLAVARRAESSGPLYPGPELGVLNVEGSDSLVVVVDEGKVVEALQYEVARVIVNGAARMAADALQE